MDPLHFDTHPAPRSALPTSALQRSLRGVPVEVTEQGFARLMVLTGMAKQGSHGVLEGAANIVTRVMVPLATGFSSLSEKLQKLDSRVMLGLFRSEEPALRPVWSVSEAATLGASICPPRAFDAVAVAS